MAGSSCHTQDGYQRSHSDPNAKRKILHLGDLGSPGGVSGLCAPCAMSPSSVFGLMAVSTAEVERVMV